jgi:26S proteasome regulatory subunit N5
LEGEDMQELKIKFYKLMIEYHCLSEKDAFEIAQHYHQIYDTAIIKVWPLWELLMRGGHSVQNRVNSITPSLFCYVQADPSLWQEALKSSIIFLILSPHSNQQSDMLHRIYRDEKLAEIPVFKDILKLYITHEIIR